MPRPTVCVLGAGFTGLLTALDLSQHVNVTVIDKRPGVHGTGTTHPSFFHGLPARAGTRHLGESFCHGDDRALCKLAMKKYITKYPLLAKHCLRTGVLYAIQDLNYYRQLLKDLGCNNNYTFLSRSESIVREPSVKVNASIIGTVHSHGDGVVHRGPLLQELYQLAKRNGVRFFFGETVLGWRKVRKSRCPVEVVTSAQRFLADAVVVALGSAAPELAPETHAGRQPTMTFFATGTSPWYNHNLPVVVPEQRMYTLPALGTSAAVLAVQTRPGEGDPDRVSKRALEQYFDQNPHGLAILRSQQTRLTVDRYTLPDRQCGGRNPLAVQLEHAVFLNGGHGDSPFVYGWLGSQRTTQLVLNGLVEQGKLQSSAGTPQPMMFKVKKHATPKIVNAALNHDVHIRQRRKKHQDQGTRQHAKKAHAKLVTEAPKSFLDSVDDAQNCPKRGVHECDLETETSEYMKFLKPYYKNPKDKVVLKDPALACAVAAAKNLLADLCQ